jgi:hypothetical protein
MPLLPFAKDEEMLPQASRLAPLLRSQAQKGVFWGSSSWKYDGWLGSIYSPSSTQLSSVGGGAIDGLARAGR